MVNPAFNRAHEKRRYFGVRPKGQKSWAICETEAEARQIGGEEDGGYELKETWLTLDEFEAMPDHGGW